METGHSLKVSYKGSENPKEQTHNLGGIPGMWHEKYDLIFEPVHETTNNLGSDQVQHKPDCTVTEDG